MEWWRLVSHIVLALVLVLIGAGIVAFFLSAKKAVTARIAMDVPVKSVQTLTLNPETTRRLGTRCLTMGGRALLDENFRFVGCTIIKRPKEWVAVRGDK